MASTLIISIFFISIISSIIAEIENDWEVWILHTNDMHSRFDEFSTPSSQCLPEHKIQKKCYGGFARLATKIRNARETNRSVIFLNAGDNYQGTPWFNEYKWEIVTQFTNILKPNVSTLGNHEFDLGPEGLVPYLKSVDFPIVACNVDFSTDPILKTINIPKSIILTVEGRKIGIIGYLTPHTQNISKTGNVTFFDEIDSIKKAVKELQDEGVNILIGLGHSGYELDKKIAKEVEGLDLIVGGHSHSFLYTGDLPSSEKPEGPYPTVITQKSGKKVYVVQAYAFTKYIGSISITFDAEGEIKKFMGEPLLMDHHVPQAEDVLDELTKLRPRIEKYYNETIGFSRVLLYHAIDCRTKECNLGNLVTDAMIEDNIKNIEVDTEGWTDAAIAIIGSGTIKASIEKSPNEAIRMVDIKHALPHENKILKIQISGDKLLSVLEHSVESLQHKIIDNDPSGRFLHFSGLQVSYDLSKPEGSKVVQDLLLIRCADCPIPKYEKFIRDKNYTILFNEFVGSGGDGYNMLKDLTPLSVGITLEESLANYMKQRITVFPSVEGRIEFIDPDKNIAIDLDVEAIIELIADE